MNKTNAFVGLLVVLLIVSAVFNLTFFQKNKGCKFPETESGNSELNLIDNENTKNLSKLPEGWTTYKNEAYGFQISYPEIFEGQKVRIVQTEFSTNQELYAQLQANKIPDDTKWLSGYSEMNKKIMDFNYLKEDKTDTSLFAITVYSNPSNLSLHGFVSNEILNMPEGIDDQKIVNINGNYGYRVIITKSIISMPSVITYYLIAKDNKTIIGVSSPIEMFEGGYGPNFEFEGFISVYPKYKENLEDMQSFETSGDWEAFDKKYPEYKGFIENLSAQYAKKELDKRLIFEQIAYSFKL